MEKTRVVSGRFDSLSCNQTLEDNTAFIQRNVLAEFERLQKRREAMLKEMLKECNEVRSKTYYCIASTVLEIQELVAAFKQAKAAPGKLDLKGKAKLLSTIRDSVAEKREYCLKLRK